MRLKKIKPQTYQSPVAIPPGETLLEVLEEKGVSQTELARRMGRPLKVINEIIKGKAAITAETAIQLEQVLSIPANVWTNLESSYQEVKARLKNEGVLLRESKEAIKFPYEEMMNWEWVPKTSDVVERTKNLLNYFGVTSLSNIIESQRAASALFRISKKSQYSIYAITAWLRKGILEAQQIETKAFDAKKLKSQLEVIRTHTNSDPDVFMQKLKDIFADCGIAFVVTPNLKNAPLNGASRWIASDKVLIQLSIRHSFSDIFWFSLFHEIGHVLFHGKKSMSIDIDRLNKNDEKEKEADKFACDTLLSEEDYADFISERQFDRSSVIAFSKKQKISPAIVVGRLQHEGHISYKECHELRPRFKWVDEN